jgi:acetoacetyl-[acyl-carrier protein] synthase
MLRARYSAEEWRAWEHANEAVREQQQQYDDAMIAGTVDPVYKFDHGVLQDSDVEVGADQLMLGGKVVRLDLESPYDDMRID